MRCDSLVWDENKVGCAMLLLRSTWPASRRLGTDQVPCGGWMERTCRPTDPARPYMTPQEVMQLLRGRPKGVASQARELRQCKIDITPFDCPRDNQGSDCQDQLVERHYHSPVR